ncbi:4-hydroxy-3-methylbut-2-enyl diphosphate reductase [Alkaliphilus peptidifermentans]|uniref:4-hydroxy-3-methylbut-2-enyl diphosphate reductase n=1 Tax=Alkaliphilus peptidifermentans DSM 18978 TaxID=1120976 RepID=A0A1G5KMN3_9FIRM|nr:4-hydroxy-3-methylbut-2-enyl diphosphate reductase [Alkaliphilus peptidifermentans]SCZ01330.1 4-hydroxy-3-methylbut-2-enyl diphosphate reductase [Alkaliphilus peptidifermentans DSM 18978]
MKVILADYSGFCFGVKKAMDMVYDEIKEKGMEKELYSLGPLIHNQQVVEELENKGVKVEDDIEKIQKGSVIIRSHGVQKDVYSLAGEKSLDIVDATCPFVRRIQNIVENYHKDKYEIVIIGNPNHPEVIGINGWCNNQAFIIQEEEDVKKIPYSEKLCIVVQTTMSTPHFQKIAKLLEEKGNKIEIFNTICNATKERQDAARKLAKEVQAMIVVGGYHSSNTQKLVDICKEERPSTTYHVESVHELQDEWLIDIDVVGVTAGASTPQWIIDELLQKLNRI